MISTGLTSTASFRWRPELPGWDDMMIRSRVREGRRRRRLVVLAAVMLMAVGTASAFGVRALILDEGFVGVPPDGATPSAPESGELVLAYFGPDPYFTDPYFRPDPSHELSNAATTWLWVYADGRLISHRNGDFVEGANRLSAGFLEQRLTAEGVELLRSEVVSTLLRPDQPSPDIQLPWFYIAVRDGDRLVKLEPDEPLNAHFPITSSEFKRFVARLTHPESWLPASAWVERQIRAYVPARYAVCYTGGTARAPIEPTRILSAPPAKAEELRAQAEELLGRPAPHEHCGGLTTDEARAFRRGSRRWRIREPAARE